MRERPRMTDEEMKASMENYLTAAQQKVNPRSLSSQKNTAPVSENEASTPQDSLDTPPSQQSR
jgi:hypothetical protein